MAKLVDVLVDRLLLFYGPIGQPLQPVLSPSRCRRGTPHSPADSLPQIPQSIRRLGEQARSAGKRAQAGAL